MKTKGHIYLRIAGVVEAFLGISSIAVALVLLSKDPTGLVDLGGINVSNTLWSLVWLYAFSGFQVIAGLVGTFSANNARKAGLCTFLGVLLVVGHIVTLATGNLSGEAATGIVQYVQVVIPVAYLVGAILNKSSR